MDRKLASIAFNAGVLDPRRRRQPLVIEPGWSPDSPSEDVAELRAVLDSIVIQPG
jgi:hypothetical protein